MTTHFFDQPILNSPYQSPSRHWELDDHGQPTDQVAEGRRKASFVTPIPKPKKQSQGQIAIALDEGKGLSTESQRYDIRSRTP
jgi:type III restriction enzyme